MDENDTVPVTWGDITWLIEKGISQAMTVVSHMATYATSKEYADAVLAEATQENTRLAWGKFRAAEQAREAANN